jgi:hypothetical protein
MRETFDGGRLVSESGCGAAEKQIPYGNDKGKGGMTKGKGGMKKGEGGITKGEGE